MILKEEVFRIKNLMGIILENDGLNSSSNFFFTRKKETNDYITFENIDRPFDGTIGEKVTLINEKNPDEKYEFTYGVDIMQSKFRGNEAYTKKVKTNNTNTTNFIQNSKFIRDSIEKAFPMGQYDWQEETDEYTKGLRGVYPLSQDDDWSVLNFFDTNPHRKESLYKLFLNSGKSNQKEWLINFLKGDSQELKDLVNKQRYAILKSDKSEVDAMSLITDNYNLSQKKGIKTDRYDGIDGTDNNTGETYQIKNVESVTENVDTNTGEIYWEVKGKYSRLKDYRIKTNLDNLAYYIPEQKTVYVFGNQNYKVVSTDLVYHYEEPKIYK